MAAACPSSLLAQPNRKRHPTASASAASFPVPIQEMEQKTKLHFTYVVEGPVAVGNVDTYFYSNISVVQTEVIDLHIGRPITSIPPTEQSIRVTGSSIVSCATLAGIIKKYLQNRKSRIVIEGTDQQVEYKGPELKTKIEEIEKMIYSLTRDSGENGLLIMAYRWSEPG